MCLEIEYNMGWIFPANKGSQEEGYLEKQGILMDKNSLRIQWGGELGTHPYLPSPIGKIGKVLLYDHPKYILS